MWFALEYKSVPQRRILILSIPISCCFKASFNEDVHFTDVLNESAKEVQKLLSNISKYQESSRELKYLKCFFFFPFFLTLQEMQPFPVKICSWKAI